MKNLAIIITGLCLIFSTVLFAQIEKHQVAITIDDLPIAAGARRYPVEIQKEIIDKLISALKKENVAVIGFVNEDQLYRDGKVNDRKVDLLRSWLSAGFELGNHTFSHKSANEIPVEDFETEILNGEKILKPLIKEYGRELRYFRHPFLNTGRSLEVKNEIESFLDKNGYIIAPVTIDNSEWIYAAAYEKAFVSKDESMLKKTGEEYVEYMKSKFDWYEKKSSELFNRNISHTLLFHANRLNSDYFGKLCSMIREKGYQFISLGEALEDEAYKTKDTFIKAGGISWMDRWALTAGKTKEFFTGEPRAPKWIMDYTGIESE